MVKRIVLSPTPQRLVQERLGALARATKDQTTVPTGNKDLGENGNIVWTRPDDPEFHVSIREVDADLADAQERIDAAEAELQEATGRLGSAEQAVEDARDRLDNLPDMEGVQEAIDGLGDISDLGRLQTQGPPPSSPIIGRTLWVAPNGRTYRAIECKEHQ